MTIKSTEGSSGSFAAPSGIVAYYNISISTANTVQPPYDIRLRLDPVAENAVAAEGLINLLVFNGISRTTISAWVESGADNATSREATVWIGPFNYSLSPSGGQNIISIGFSRMNVREMNGVITGEAPQLSINDGGYGKYDNGNVVFPILYQNFSDALTGKGSHPPNGWHESANTTGIGFKNGVRIGNGTGVDKYLLTNQMYGLQSNQMLSFYGNVGGAIDVGYLDDCGLHQGICALDSNSMRYGVGYTFVDNNYTQAYTSTIAGATYGEQYANGNVLSIVWTSNSAAKFLDNYIYGNVIMQRTVKDPKERVIPLPMVGNFVGLAGNDGTNILANLNWIRISEYPDAWVSSPPNISLGNLVTFKTISPQTPINASTTTSTINSTTSTTSLNTTSSTTLTTTSTVPTTIQNLTSTSSSISSTSSQTTTSTLSSTSSTTTSTIQSTATTSITSTTVSAPTKTLASSSTSINLTTNASTSTTTLITANSSSTSTSTLTSASTSITTSVNATTIPTTSLTPSSTTASTTTSAASSSTSTLNNTTTTKSGS